VDAEGPQQLDDGLDLGGLPGGLQRVGVRRHVDHLRPEDVADAQDLRPVRRLGVHLQQEHLALHVILAGEVRDLDHVDQLVQLLDHLLDDEGVAPHDEGHPRHRGIERLPDGETLDVVAAGREEPGHA
jgi:hypothetical protein